MIDKDTILNADIMEVLPQIPDGTFKTQREAVEARNRFIDENGLMYHQKNTYRGELSNGY